MPKLWPRPRMPRDSANVEGSGCLEEPPTASQSTTGSSRRAQAAFLKFQRTFDLSGDEKTATETELVDGPSRFGLTGKAEGRGDIHQGGEGIGFHLSHHVASMCFYCDFADPELATDLFVQ